MAMTEAVHRAAAAVFSDRAGLGPRSRGTASAMVAASAAASGRLTQKTRRQLARSVTIPPMTKPLPPAAAPAALQVATARRRCGPSVVSVVSSRSAEGTEAAAAAPCRQRATVSVTTEPASAPSSAARANTARLAMMVRRWPKRSASRAPSISSPPKNMAYPPEIRLPAEAGARRSPSILGNAVTTTVTPSTSTNWTEHRAAIVRVPFLVPSLVAMFRQLPRFFVNKPLVMLTA